MTEGFARANDVHAAEAALQRDLARGEIAVGSVVPVLRYLLTTEDKSIFAEDVVATVHGMLRDLARQLLNPATPPGEATDLRPDPQRVEALAHWMIEQSEILCHVHVLAVEAQLAARLEVQLGLDQVLSPLLQALTGANAPQIADNATAFLAAQARFVADCRKMQLPLNELPGELLHGLLLHVEEARAIPECTAAFEAIRTHYDESRSRLGLLGRLIAALGGGATAALSLSHSGVAIFLSALAHVSGQERASIVLATSESQAARLTLILRAAGLSQSGIAELVSVLHPDRDFRPLLDGRTYDQAAKLAANLVPGSGN